MTEAAPAENRIALRDGRQRAEALITARYAEGLLDADELDQRLERLQDAETLASLEQLIVDLVEPGTEPGAALTLATSSGAPARGAALARPEGIADERRVSAVFANVEQAGAWVPARHNRVLDVFAEATLDFRTAPLGPGVTEIAVKCVFSSLTLLVPPGLAVRVDASVVFGAVERDPDIIEQPRGPEDPLLVVTGLVLFASLEIHERLSGEDKRDTRRRHRALRRAARRRAALPPGRQT